MSEICQSCGGEILTESVPAAFSTALMKSVGVEFDVVGGVWRRWRMCESCAQTLQNMVLGFMGELPPGDESEEEPEEESSEILPIYRAAKLIDGLETAAYDKGFNAALREHTYTYCLTEKEIEDAHYRHKEADKSQDELRRKLVSLLEAAYEPQEPDESEEEPGGEVDEPPTLMEAVELLKNGSCAEYLKALAVVEKYAKRTWIDGAETEETELTAELEDEDTEPAISEDHPGPTLAETVKELSEIGYYCTSGPSVGMELQCTDEFKELKKHARREQPGVSLMPWWDTPPKLTLVEIVERLRDMRFCCKTGPLSWAGLDNNIGFALLRERIEREADRDEGQCDCD